MARSAKFTPKKTVDGWMVYVPAVYSDTGKAQRRFFTSKEKARFFADDLKDRIGAHGAGYSVLPPRVQDDAVAAWRVLEPLGISLLAAAQRVAAEVERSERSCGVEEALGAWLAERAEDLRERTLVSYRQTMQRLLLLGGGRLLSEVSGREIVEVLQGGSYAIHRRNARAFWNWCVAKGWCAAEVFRDVPGKKVRESEIGVLSVEEVEVLLRTAEEYAPEIVGHYALRLFAGLRSEEVVRLGREHVRPHGIEMSAEITKKGRRRFINLSEVLRAWLDVYPFAPVARYAELDRAVRAAAGWRVQSKICLKADAKEVFGVWKHNATRHTHASVAMAVGGISLESLLFEFGHTESPSTLRKHYLGIYSKGEAEAIWGLRPRKKA